MARTRNIKPGYFKNEMLAECRPLARILFAGLWCEADREGRVEDRPRRLKAEILPYDDCDIDELLDELAVRDFIQRYEVDGARYIQVLTFKAHQNPHPRETESKIPPVDGDVAPSIGKPQGELPLSTNDAAVERRGQAAEIPEPAAPLILQPSNPHPDDPQHDAAARARVVVVDFLNLRSQIWPQERPPPTSEAVLAKQASGYLGGGASELLCREVFERVMREKLGKGDGPPSDLRFCHRSIASELAKLNRAGAPSAKVVRLDRAPPPEPWDQRVKACRDSGFWRPEHYGPAPGEADCRAPPDVLAKYGYRTPPTKASSG